MFFFLCPCFCFLLKPVGRPLLSHFSLKNTSSLCASRFFSSRDSSLSFTLTPLILLPPPLLHLPSYISISLPSACWWCTFCLRRADWLTPWIHPSGDRASTTKGPHSLKWSFGLIWFCILHWGNDSKRNWNHFLGRVFFIVSLTSGDRHNLQIFLSRIHFSSVSVLGQIWS